MDRQVLAEAKTKMSKAIDYLLEELKTIRTGRASTALVEHVQVSYYDQRVPLKQVASISTPDAKSLTITPWDQSMVAAIEKAIREDEKLGLNPMNDGKNIHIAVPPLTQERREQIAKQLGDKAEECRIVLRNARHDALQEAKRLQKDGEMSEDESRRIEKELGQAIDDSHKKIDSAIADKRAELMAV